MANPFHKFPSGRGASSSISSFETGCMNRTLRACSQMLYSDETLTLSYVALWANDYDEKLEDMELVFCVENSSGNDLSIFDEQIQVNGEACDVSLWASVPANSKTLFTAYLYGIDLDRPEDIESFIMDLNVCPEDGDGYLIENISVPINE